MLKVGQIAPDFSLPDQDGTLHSPKDYAGKWVLLYYYPKDDTPGCTTEACTIRDSYQQFKDAGLTVLGVSKDSVKSHQKFADKYQLPFTILADEEKQAIEAYEVWALKKFAGREYMGILRTSFLIDPTGKIAKIYEKVKPTEHAGEVLVDIAKLKGGA